MDNQVKPFTGVFCPDCKSEMRENIPNDPRYWQTGWHCQCGYGFVLPWNNSQTVNEHADLYAALAEDFNKLKG